MPSDVLPQERDILAVLRLDAQMIVSPLEATLDPAARYLLYTASLIAAGGGAGENRFVDISTQQSKGDVGVILRDQQIPQNL